MVEADDYSKYNGYYCGPYSLDGKHSLRLYLGEQGRIEEISLGGYYLRIYKDHSTSGLIRFDWWKNLGLFFAPLFYGFSFLPGNGLGYLMIEEKPLPLAVPLTESLLHQLNLNYYLTERDEKYEVKIGNDDFQIIFTFPRPWGKYPLNKIIELRQGPPDQIVKKLQALGFDFRLVR